MKLKASKQASHGFSLIEVLVTITVLAFGMLGMLGVITQSLKLSASSSERSVAAQQATAIAEILRANPGSIAAFASPSGALQLSCLKSAGCSASDYVASAYQMWQGRLAEALPGGQGTICRDSDPANHQPTLTNSTATWNCDSDGQFVVKICWDGSRVAASSPAYRPGSTALCTWTNL